jgi:DHA3 family tetracycline resistance protein-like MFS transporter
VLGDLRDGFATVLGSPWLWISIAIAGVSNIAVAGPLAAALPLLVKDELGAGARTYGLLNSLAAVGAVGAAVWLGRRRRLRRRGWLMYGAWVVLALATAAIGLPIGVGGVAAAMLVEGAAGAVLGLAWTSTLQEPAIVAPERLGRVASIDALGSYALLPVGFALAGVAADRVGAPLVFVLGGTLGGAVIGLGLLHPEVRGLD